ncbi:MAG: hypothetical protein AAGU27_24860 [Dehalobacterium sp.]
MKAMIPAKTLRRIVMATRGFVSKAGSNRPAYEYIKLEFSKGNSSVTAVAVDGYRLSVEHASCDVDEDFSAYIKPMLPPIKGNEWAMVTVDGERAYVEIGGLAAGFVQPKEVEFDYRGVVDNARKNAPTYRIGFNGDFLLTALKAAKESCGASFKLPVILEFRGPNEPILLVTNSGDDVKMVLPVRIK